VFSVIFLILLVASAPVVYYMRRNVYFAAGWFLALAVFGFLIPPATAHVECLPVALPDSSSAVRCVEKPVEDPLAPAVKIISMVLFILSLAAAAVALLFDAGRLISRWLR